MEIKDLIIHHGENAIWELAQVQTLAELEKQLEARDIHLSHQEAERLMEVLSPLRGKEKPLSDEDLEVVSGGSAVHPVDRDRPPYRPKEIGRSSS